MIYFLGPYPGERDASYLWPDGYVPGVSRAFFPLHAPAGLAVRIGNVDRGAGGLSAGVQLMSTIVGGGKQCALERCAD